MRVQSKTDASNHVFSAISKEEVQPISAFLQSKNVRLKNEMEEAMEVDPISDEDMDDDDDDVSIPSEDERGRKVKDKGKKVKGGDDEDDESGESFQLYPLLSYSKSYIRSFTFFHCQSSSPIQGLNIVPSGCVCRKGLLTSAEDEDFQSGSSDGGSPSESDSDEDSDAASDATDPMMEEIKKRQASKKKKQEGSGSDEESKPKKKKAKKEEEDD